MVFNYSLLPAHYLRYVDADLLVVSTSWLVNTFHRAFAIFTPRLWNALVLKIRRATPLRLFKYQKLSFMYVLILLCFSFNSLTVLLPSILMLPSVFCLYCCLLLFYSLLGLCSVKHFVTSKRTPPTEFEPLKNSLCASTLHVFSCKKSLHGPKLT